MPGSPVALIFALTSTSLSVIRLTSAPSDTTLVTLPISAPSAITGSLTRTPAEEPWSITIVEYQTLGDW